MKFSLTKNTKVEFGITFYQIKAEETRNGINKGDLGGWVEKKENLGNKDNAWICGNALVFGNARVFGNAWVFGNALVFGNAWIFGDTQVCGNAWIFGNAWIYGDTQIHGDTRIYGDARIFGDTRIYGDAWIFGDAWVYGNARVYGKLKISHGNFFGMRFNNEEIKYKKIRCGEELIYKGEAKFDDEEDDGVEKAIKLLTEKGKLKDGKILI